MILRDIENGYIKFYYPIKTSSNNLFDKVKKESSLQAKMIGSVEGVGDVFDLVAITNDEELQFEESLDIVFYPIADIFKMYGLDYQNLNAGAFSMVMRETVDISGTPTDVYSIYTKDREAVSNSTLVLLDQNLERYIIYALVNSVEKFMNKNQYLDLTDRMLIFIEPIQSIIYMCSMECSKTVISCSSLFIDGGDTTTSYFIGGIDGGDAFTLLFNKTLECGASDSNY